MPNDRLNPIELAAYQALLESSSLLQQRMGQQLKEDGNLTPPQFEILAYAAKAPDGLRMSDLATRAVHSRSGMTYRVTQLEKLGLVKRRGNDDDERSVIVTATPKGAALMRRVLPRHLALLRESFFSVLSPNDLAAVNTILARVVTHLRSPKRGRGKRTMAKATQATARAGRRG